MRKKDVASNSVAKEKIKKKRYYFSDLKTNWQLYVMILIPLAYIIVFKYLPMYGTSIAFLDYKPIKGFSGSDYVGFDNFTRFIESPQFFTLIKNTLAISIYGLVLTIPFPIILALCVNYLKNKTFKKTVQMVTYLPHFLSTVIIVSHSMEDMARLCDDLIVLSHGEVVLNGSRDEVFSHSQMLEQIGLAVTQITLLMHELNARGINVNNGIYTEEAAVEEIAALLKGKK